MKKQIVPTTSLEQRLRLARQAYFGSGLDVPEDLIAPLVSRSWERCRRFGLDGEYHLPAATPIDRVALKTEQDRNRQLLNLGRPVMEHVFEQIRNSGSMVILADSSGLLLDTVGDAEFLDKAGRVALSAGASWDEMLRGTNAIGTALAEESSVEIRGEEHYLSSNGFLTCCASPIFGPDGRLIGALDISGDFRGYQPHTLGLVRVSSAMMEKRLFESLHGRDLMIRFHPQPEYLGSLKEGLIALSGEGQVLAINRQGLDILGLRRFDVVDRDFVLVFENNLASLVDRHRLHPMAPGEIRIGSQVLAFQLSGQIPVAQKIGRVIEDVSPVSAGSSASFTKPQIATAKTRAKSLLLDQLNTGDLQLDRAIHRAKRVLDRDIPVLIQGESGVGKELFAKAFHASSQRKEAAFVALNCASIPETLIESELFGYQGGAFTGARKEGALGKIQQADRGTLFLDEIGDMPLSLQARLLRVLQERVVTPLGSHKTIPVDIALVCATHLNLRDAVSQGHFREDLYYRLNGLSLTLPTLRERSDFPALVDRLLDEHADSIKIAASAMKLMAGYHWPGNIRQLNNVIRLAVALLDDGETVITEAHLPDEVFESVPLVTFKQTSKIDNLENQNLQAISQALSACQGNVSAAARQLGISRNTLYRKLNKG
jgi:transcriptional regulator of acetoin/glycerol metabolism